MDNKEELIRPFDFDVNFSKEEDALVAILMEVDISAKLIRSILNQIAREMVGIDVGEDGLLSRIRLRVKYNFYKGLYDKLQMNIEKKRKETNRIK